MKNIKIVVVFGEERDWIGGKVREFFGMMVMFFIFLGFWVSILDIVIKIFLRVYLRFLFFIVSYIYI